MKRQTVLTCALSLAALIPTGGFAASPTVIPGWPVPAAAGTVHLGPEGGPVVISDLAGFQTTSSVAAFGRTGSLRWLNVRSWDCGNCDNGPQIAELQPDGTFGPLGPEGDGPWAVAPDGSTVGTCTGVTLPDRTCIAYETQVSPAFELTPSITARRGGLAWEYLSGVGPWHADGDDAPLKVVRDAAGGIYSSFGDRFVGATVPQRMIALTPTGQLRWEAPGAAPLVGLETGVLASRFEEGLVAFTVDGSVLWTARGLVQGLWSMTYDRPRQRIYASRGSAASEDSMVIALDSLTGNELWRTAERDHARLVSVDASSGVVYVAIDRLRQRGLKAIGPDGRGRWQFDTTTPVVGARRLSDGTVALTTDGVSNDYSQEPGGLVWRIRPNGPPATKVLSGDVSIQRTTFRRGCDFQGRCPFQKDVGTLVRIALPRRGSLLIRMLGAARRADIDDQLITAPAGVSYVRVLGTSFTRPGRKVIHVRGRVGNQTLNVSIQVRITK